jgi:hypothetical protein
MALKPERARPPRRTTSVTGPERARHECLDPAAIRRELAELSRRFDEGLISAEEFEALEESILDRQLLQT